MPGVEPLGSMPAGRVAWQAWADRDSADAADRPTLLFLYSARSFWCRDLVNRCFADENLAREVERGFRAVRVDADRRPDLAARFGMGGWPTLAFLGPGHAIVTGSTYVDPEDLRDLIRRVRIHFDYEDRRQDLAVMRSRLAKHLARKARLRPRPELPPSRELLRRVADSTVVSASRGVWIGPEAVMLLVELGRDAPDSSARAAAQGRLEVFAAGMVANADGLVRLPLTRDGAVLAQDAGLAVSAGVLGAVAAAAKEGAGTRWVRETRALSASLTRLLLLEDEGLLAAGLAGFREGGADTVLRDTTVYSGWNELAVSAFVAANRATGDREYLDTANRIHLAVSDRMVGPDGAMMHQLGGQALTPAFLADQALSARAALDLYDLEGGDRNLAHARRLATMMLGRFVSVSGALHDRHPETGQAHIPVLDHDAPSGTGVAAQVLVRLFQETGEREYLIEARRILAACIGPNIDRAAHLGSLGRALRLYLLASRNADRAD